MNGSLISVLEEKVANHPDFLLYTFIESNSATKTLTYSGLAEQAKKIAYALQEKTHPGDRVLIIYPPGLELISAFFGCLYAGVIVVPVYPPGTHELVVKLKHIIDNSGAKVILTTQAIRQQLKKLQLAKWITGHNFLHKTTQRLLGSNFSHTLQLADWDFEKMVFIATDSLPKSVNAYSQIELAANTTAFLQYTSGSTGTPKGVIITHGNLLHNLKVMEQANEIQPKDVCVSWLPPYHDMGLIGGILLPFFSHFAVKLMSPLTFLQRPAIWLETITKYQATGTAAPNFAYDLCVTKVTEAEKKHLDLSSLHIMKNGAEPIRRATMERFIDTFTACGFPEKAFFPCYGLAESTLMVTRSVRKQGAHWQVVDGGMLNQGIAIQCEEDHPNARSIINCGQAADGIHLIIVNPENLQKCADRTIGEIWVASHSVAQGYWQLAAETEQIFNAHCVDEEHSFLRTGDLGYLDKGFLYVTGRLKDLIIIKGRNYYPHDIEYSIQTCHPDLRINCGAVFAVEEEDRELVVVVQEIKESTNYIEIVQAIRHKILHCHGIAADIVVLVKRKSVPKTTSGKIQRLLCKTKYLKNQLDIIFLDKTSTPNDLIHTLFNMEEGALDKKLSELGTSSLHLVAIQQALTHFMGTEISSEFLLMDPSIQDVLDVLRGIKNPEELVRTKTIDLAIELAKYENFTTETPCLGPIMPQHVLLTGATGFLGAYLVHELLQQTTWKITCLVQAASQDAGMQRIIDNLQLYNLWKPAYRTRIHVILGNLERVQLNLSPYDWDKLASEIDLIVHSAAVLNFIYPYQKLAGANVIGTKQLLELAAYKRFKAFHFVSTIGYFMSADLPPNTLVNEQTILEVTKGIYGGYNQTKWLAEQIVLQARNHNIPTVIYRPSLITGASQTGHWNQNDVVCRFLKGCIQLQARPKLNLQLNCVPVDYVAQSLICFVKETPFKEDIYHLLNPNTVDFEHLFGFINAKGFKVNALDYSDWEKMIQQNQNGVLDKSLSPLKPFFTEKIAPQNTSLFNLYLNNKIIIDSSYTQDQLAHYGIHCKKIDEIVLNRYIDYLISIGYLTKPKQQKIVSIV